MVEHRSFGDDGGGGFAAAGGGDFAAAGGENSPRSAAGRAPLPDPQQQMLQQQLGPAPSDGSDRDSSPVRIVERPGGGDGGREVRTMQLRRDWDSGSESDDSGGRRSGGPLTFERRTKADSRQGKITHARAPSPPDAPAAHGDAHGDGVEAMFEDALADCAAAFPLPFCLSLVSSRVQDLCPGFNVRDTKWGKFTELAVEMAELGVGGLLLRQEDRRGMGANWIVTDAPRTPAAAAAAAATVTHASGGSAHAALTAAAGGRLLPVGIAC
eukprot:gene20236-57163_t